jgi:2-methylcitrate dehydratase
MDGSSTENVVVEYPVGHRRRRAEGLPLLVKKFEASLRGRFAEEQAGVIMGVCMDHKNLLEMPVNQFVDLWVMPGLK